jgi:hypothetical protein
LAGQFGRVSPFQAGSFGMPGAYGPYGGYGQAMSGY